MLGGRRGWGDNVGSGRGAGQHDQTTHGGITQSRENPHRSATVLDPAALSGPTSYDGAEPPRQIELVPVVIAHDNNFDQYPSPATLLCLIF
ncbi:hypothetical protein FRC12_025096 [Ceratobasidium sp. 428]|nr:hypothetical protein FRC12_025096 [Ceratobasidium sp. 428]